MTALPSNADFNTSTNTEGQVKTAITNLLAYLVGILGADGTLSTALDTLGSCAIRARASSPSTPRVPN
jgi:hypothetical protein